MYLEVHAFLSTIIKVCPAELSFPIIFLFKTLKNKDFASPKKVFLCQRLFKEPFLSYLLKEPVSDTKKYL